MTIFMSMPCGSALASCVVGTELKLGSTPSRDILDLWSAFALCKWRLGRI